MTINSQMGSTGPDRHPPEDEATGDKSVWEFLDVPAPATQGKNADQLMREVLLAYVRDELPRGIRRRISKLTLTDPTWASAHLDIDAEEMRRLGIPLLPPNGQAGQ